MTNLTERGWGIPGGHIDSVELPEQTVQREILEETSAYVYDLRVFGYDKFIIQALRARQIDVATVSEANLLGQADDVQLRYATEQGRVIFTFRGFPPFQ